MVSGYLEMDSGHFIYEIRHVEMDSGRHLKVNFIHLEMSYRYQNMDSRHLDMDSRHLEIYSRHLEINSRIMRRV